VKVFAVFELSDSAFKHRPDQLYSLWVSRELAETEARRLLEAWGTSFEVREMDVQDKAPEPES
jgi:hypothetical protein